MRLLTTKSNKFRKLKLYRATYRIVSLPISVPRKVAQAISVVALTTMGDASLVLQELSIGKAHSMR